MLASVSVQVDELIDHCVVNDEVLPEVSFSPGLSPDVEALSMTWIVVNAPYDNPAIQQQLSAVDRDAVDLVASREFVLAIGNVDVGIARGSPGRPATRA